MRLALAAGQGLPKFAVFSHARKRSTRNPWHDEAALRATRTTPPPLSLELGGRRDKLWWQMWNDQHILTSTY